MVRINDLDETYYQRQRAVEAAFIFNNHAKCCFDVSKVKLSGKSLIHWSLADASVTL